MEHIVVYKERGRFGGWPANHGLWKWGNEVVVGFQSCSFKIIDDANHAIDKTQPRYHLQARSTDGGRTWEIEEKPEIQDWYKISGSKFSNNTFNMTNPNGALTFKQHPDKDGSILLFFSTDRCNTWSDPLEVRIFKNRNIEPRIDYIVFDTRKAICFLTAVKDNGKEGRVFCAQTTDGGQTWQFLSWIGEEIEGFNIMPSTIQLPDGCLLCTTRWQEAGEWGIDTYISDDEGLSWKFHGRVLQHKGLSNPPSLILLKDGRLCLTYGFRDKPYGIRACFSYDNGKTWKEERILRDDGGHWDLGYVRSTELPSGEVLSVYYFCEDKRTERTIEATIWQP
ncbi:MAG: sialidase family protein [Sphaerochaetaceae bacterium]|nr:sialidase family protein [Sphaerochaetaceae bacterium]